jgi:iron(III) transport system permease protein
VQRLGTAPRGAPKSRLLPLIVLLPSIAVALATLLPLVYLVVRAAGAGADFWPYLLRPRSLEAIWTTLFLAFCVTTLTLVLALPVAWLTLRTDLPGRRLWFILCMLPLVIPTYVGSFALISVFATGGLLSDWLGLTFPSVYGFGGALIVLTLFTFPYMLLALRAGFRTLDASLEEAARSLGYSQVRTFFAVTLPHLRPAIAAGALLVSLYVVSDFGAVAMLRVDTLTRSIFVQYQSSFNRSIAAALALVLVGLSIGIMIVDRFVRGRVRLSRTGAGAARAPAFRPLGRWAFPAQLYLGLLVAVSLAAPLGVVGIWLWRGTSAGLYEGGMLEWSPIWSALRVSLVSALVSSLLALPVAVLAVRFPSRTAALLERLSYLGHALPGLVVALALVFFGARYVPWLYQTEAMLIFAYVVLFLSLALGNIRTSLLSVNPHLEEAARSLGRSPAQVLWQVTLPLVRSGFVTGAALVFLATMKELPATLLLGPTGFNTLATRIWSWTVEAFFAQAAPYCLVLIAVSAASLALLLSRDKDA